MKMETEVFNDDIYFNILERLANSGEYTLFNKFLRTVRKPSRDLLTRISKLEHPLTFVVRIGTHPLTKTRYDKFTIPFEQATKVNIRVDWGDSYTSHYNLETNDVSSDERKENFHISHLYDDVPSDKFINFKVKVYGLLNHLGTNENTNNNKWANNIVEFVSLGKIGIISLDHLFYRSQFNRSISHLDVSEIISAKSMLESNSQFNQKISDMRFDNLIFIQYMLNKATRVPGNTDVEPVEHVNAPLLKTSQDLTQNIKNKQRIRELIKTWTQQFGSATVI